MGLTQSSFDSASAKNLVIVKEIIDVKQLISYLKLKRTVEVVPAKTEEAVAEVQNPFLTSLLVVWVNSIVTDSAKNLVTVKGIIDVKQLIPSLKLRHTVEVVPAKTEEAVAEVQNPFMISLFAVRV
ncbi:hypothetical protein IGI04_039003 [Brassica rapa subsp. trilocularis]|uniref:CBS domain-containing protein n=1 Tax=Brassica rapa subsp. trilocularis TaxID=1813537 RepID=A0ABQ7LLS5_BRACM|nr:hypothetical protein IGI04_039003 [Brassica rapa subsp. trilocularis]